MVLQKAPYFFYKGKYMNVLFRKEELEFIFLSIDETDGRKYKKTKNLFKEFRNNKNEYIIVNVEKENIYDLYEILKEFQDLYMLDDIKLFNFEDKLIKFIDDIQSNKYYWNNKKKSKDKSENIDEIELEEDINGFS
jgi:hypothetical protein